MHCAVHNQAELKSTGNHFLITHSVTPSWKSRPATSNHCRCLPASAWNPPCEAKHQHQFLFRCAIISWTHVERVIHNCFRDFVNYCLWYCLRLTQYHQVPTIAALKWLSTTKYQLVTSYTDPLTQFHQAPISTALYWLSIAKYQSVPPYTDSVPPITSWYAPCSLA